jgi:predicted double-glycine peptidase
MFLELLTEKTSFKVGNKVFKDGDLFTIKSIKGNKVTLTDEDGGEYTFKKSEIDDESPRDKRYQNKYKDDYEKSLGH